MSIVDKYKNLLQVDDRASQGEVGTPVALVNEMLDKLPKEVFKSNNSTFLDPGFGNGTFLIEIVKRLRKEGHSIENIQERVYGTEISHRLYNKVAKLFSNYNFTKLYKEDFLTKDFSNMKFDVIIGNPPYQDGSKDGGQNKIYMFFCKQAIDLLTDKGKLAFVTPTSAAKKSKRFTLENIQGLKYIDYTSDSYFSVGSEICSWMVDKEYRGKVAIIGHNGVLDVTNEGPFYDHSKHDPNFVQLYKTLKTVTNKPELRMFKQNIAAATWGTGRNKVRTEDYQYSIHKIAKTDGKIVTQYNKKEPYFFNRRKVILPLTKSFKAGCEILDTDDYDVNYVCTEINSDETLANILSFVFSEYFVSHVNKWKKLDGYGFNEALKYLPPFDISVKWNSKKVQEFLESFNIESTVV